MAWVRKIVKGRERLVFVSDVVPKKTPAIQTRVPVPAGLTFAQKAAALAGQPRQPTQTVAQGLASAVTGVPRTLGRAGVSLAAPIVGAGVGTAATLAGGGNLVRN